MVDNLQLGGEKLKYRTLTSEDSDIPTSFALPESSTSGFTAMQFDTAWVYVSPNYRSGYYSFKAATAGTRVLSAQSGNANGSICPKGWRLPTGSSGGDFEVMINKYSLGTEQETSKALQAEPVPHFTLSGHYYNSEFRLFNTYGAYWSSTIYPSSSTGGGAYYFNFSSSNVYPNYTGTTVTNHGLAIRCIAR